MYLGDPTFLPFLVNTDNVPQRSIGDALSSLYGSPICSAIPYIFVDLPSLEVQSTGTKGDLKNIRRIAEAFADRFTPSLTGHLVKISRYPALLVYTLDCFHFL
ncbi:hypothetical protein KY289_032958 [Solanum tuberosum]|nr:hypothetical protein KY289_032958 [Solanum tuberosum]